MPYCSNCGSEVEESWNACANCGFKIGQESIPHQPIQHQSVPTPQYSQQGYAFKTGNFGLPALIIGIIGLILVVIAPLAIIFGIIGLCKDENKAKSIIGIVFGSIGTFGLFFFII